MWAAVLGAVAATAVFLPWYGEFEPPSQRAFLGHGSVFFSMYEEGSRSWNGTQWDFLGKYTFLLAVVGTCAAVRHATAPHRPGRRAHFAPLLASTCFASAALLSVVDATKHGVLREMPPDVVMRKAFGIYVTLAATGLAAACAAWSSLRSIRGARASSGPAPRPAPG